MPFIIGRKIRMDQQWDGDKVVPVTLLLAGPVVVTQIKTVEKDGYSAVQVGFDPSNKRIKKPQKGHVKELGNFRVLKEFKVADTSPFAVGNSFDVSAFSANDLVKITGVEKGRGFQGVVKRHGFHGGPKTHGQKNRLRAPGSSGATAPQRVLKGKKMAGRMGNEVVSLRKVKIVAVNPEERVIAIKGPVPGNNRSIVYIQSMDN